MDESEIQEFDVKVGQLYSMITHIFDEELITEGVAIGAISLIINNMSDDARESMEIIMETISKSKI